MQVLLVRMADALSAPGPPEDREHDIEDRNREHQQRARRRARAERPARPGSARRGLLPTPEMVAIVRSMPSSIEPVSPMKILAGKKFQGRNPKQIPTVIAESNAACDASPKKLLGLPDHEDEEGARRDGHHPGSEAVQPVDQVDGVRDRHERRRS